MNQRGVRVVQENQRCTVCELEIDAPFVRDNTIYVIIISATLDSSMFYVGCIGLLDLNKKVRVTHYLYARLLVILNIFFFHSRSLYSVRHMVACTICKLSIPCDPV